MTNGVLVLFILIGFTVKTSTSVNVTCHGIYDCPAGSYCDFGLGEVCKRQFYSSCSNSTECHVDASCVSVSQTGVMYECFSQSSTSNDKFCFCAPQKGETFGNDCAINTGELPLPSNGKIHCVPCSYLTAHKTTLQENACSTIVQFQSIPTGTKGSEYQSCDLYSDCKSDLDCFVLYSDGKISSFASTYTNNNVAMSSFCYKYPLEYCGLFIPCSSKHSCVRFVINATPICLPRDALNIVQPPFPHQYTVSKSFFLTLGLAEGIFIVLKSVSILNKEKKWLYFALFCFIVESVIGIVLTTLQAYIIVYLSTRDYIEAGVIVGALLFVLTEICAVISESIIVKKKITPGIVNTFTTAHRYRSSLVRRVIGKWISTVSSIFVLFNGVVSSHRYADVELGKVLIPICALVILMLYSIWTLFFYKRYWARIIISTIILVFSVSSCIAMLLHRNLSRTSNMFCESSFISSGVISVLSIPVVVFSIVVLATNIFLTALSAFRLQGYKEVKNICAEQVEFFETAVTGISGPCLILSIRSDLCSDQLVLLLIVAIPQVSVLITPLLFEYLHAWLKTYNWVWKRNSEIEETSES